MADTEKEANSETLQALVASIQSSIQKIKNDALSEDEKKTASRVDNCFNTALRYLSKIKPLGALSRLNVEEKVIAETECNSIKSNIQGGNQIKPQYVELSQKIDLLLTKAEIKTNRSPQSKPVR